MEQGQGIPRPAAAPVAVRVDTDIQSHLDAIMAIIDENQDKITDGEYLRAMNALGSLHKHKRTAFGAQRGGGGGGGVEGWLTLDDIVDDDDLYDEVMELADDIVVEICGENSSIYDAHLKRETYSTDYSQGMNCYLAARRTTPNPDNEHASGRAFRPHMVERVGSHRHQTGRLLS